MSAIASIYRIDIDVLAHHSGPVNEWAARYGREFDPDEFPYSGYLMMDVLLYLEDEGIPITKTAVPFSAGDGGPYSIVLTTEHRPLLPRLDPAGYTLADIRRAFDDSTELADDEVVTAFTDTLILLRDKIADLADGEGLVISIG